MISRDAEQDVVLAPASYCRLFLQPHLDKLLHRKVSLPKCVKSDDTNVVVSVMDRSERDLTKRFDELEIDWAVVEK